MGLCQTNRTPHGYESLSRYLFGDAYPEDKEPGRFIDVKDVGTCFTKLVASIPAGRTKPLERWWVDGETTARFKWTGPRAENGE